MSQNLNNIILIGMPGVGKTFIGQEISNYFNIPFYDLDNIIENKFSLTISEIFQTLGEDFFRLNELEEFFNIIKSEELKIISTGAGIIKSFESNNFNSNYHKSFIIHLDSCFDNILKNINKDNDKRPLLIGDKKTILDKLFKERQNLYIKYSDTSINIDNINYFENLKQLFY